MRATDEQIMERLTVLLSTLPMRTTDQLGIEAVLTAYCEVLEGCEIEDLRSAVSNVFASNVKWAPSAPEFGRIVLNAAAYRTHVPKALEPPPDVDKHKTSEAEYARMSEKWAAVRKSFGKRENPESWTKARVAEGVITKGADGDDFGVLPEGVKL